MTHPNPRPLPVVENTGACSLDADELGPRIARWEELLGHASGRPDGADFVWTLPAEHAAELTALVAAEGDCCPFLDLRVDHDAADVRLRVGAEPSRRPHQGTAADRALRLLTGRPAPDPG